MKLTSLFGLKVVSRKREAERDAAHQHEISMLRQEMSQTVRIGFKPFNLINVTSELRGRVEGSLRVDYDGNNISVRCNRLLEEAEYNLLVSILGFGLNRT